jgi:hypothetical protein
MEKRFNNARELAEYFFYDNTDERQWGFQMDEETNKYLMCYRAMCRGRYILEMNDADNDIPTPMTKKAAVWHDIFNDRYDYYFANMTWGEAREKCINKLAADIKNKITFPTFYKCEYHEEDNWDLHCAIYRVKYTPDNQLTFFDV